MSVKPNTHHVSHGLDAGNGVVVGLDDAHTRARHLPHASDGETLAARRADGRRDGRGQGRHHGSRVLLLRRGARWRTLKDKNLNTVICHWKYKTNWLALGLICFVGNCRNTNYTETL